MRAVIDIIRASEEKKASLGIVPSYIMYRDLLREVEEDLKAELNELYKSGAIEVGPTLNDRYIKIK